MSDQTTIEDRIAKDKLLLLEQLRKTPIVEIACSKAEIGRSSYYRWRKEDVQFAKDADEAIRDGSLLMNDLAEGYLISAIKDKNISAITLWLRSHHPSYKTRIEVEGSINTIQELSPEDKEMVRKAFESSKITLNNYGQK